MPPVRRQVALRQGAKRFTAIRGAALFALALGGCAVGAEYRSPQIDVPAQWSGPASRDALDPAALAAWWRQFGDPVLDALVEDALAANLDLATAEAQLREARAQRKLAGAQLGPTLDASASVSRSKSNLARGLGGDAFPGAAGGARARELYSVGFDASWELDVFGGLRRGVEAAEADVAARLESLRDVQVTLVGEVAVNYVDLRAAERRLAIARANLVALGDTYELARWRQQAGLVSELDVAQALTELERTRASLPALGTSAAQARNRLAVLLGRPPGELQSRLASTGDIPLAGREVALGIPADVLRQRPDVRRAERQIAAQFARLGQAEAARYPSFDLSGSIGLEALSWSALRGGDAGVHSLLASITAPIFQSGRISANIEAQHALLEQSLLAHRSAVLTALEDVENALVAIVDAGERRDKLAEAAGAARQTMRLAEQRYAGGLIDFLTVLDSQRTLHDLEDQLAGSTGELATAQAQLYKALGGGWSPEAGRDPEARQ